MEITRKNTAQAVGALLIGATLGLLFAPAKASKTRKLIRKKKGSDDLRKKIKEATNTLKKKTASKVADLEHKIEHNLDHKTGALKNVAPQQRRPLYRHN